MTSATPFSFERLHELMQSSEKLEELGSAPGCPERRVEERHSYPYIQLLAPFDGSNMPLQADFRHVYCHNISSHGFAFFESPEPSYKKVVVMFGKLPFRVYTAEVRHIQKTSTPDIYLIGCRFLARLPS